MSYGLVRRMRDNFFDTPNRGELIDLATGVCYKFARPDSAGTVKPGKWNVHEGDIVSYTLSGDVATNVILYKVRKDKVVYGTFPIFGDHSHISGVSHGSASVLVEIGGRLRLVGSTAGSANVGI